MKVKLLKKVRKQYSIVYYPSRKVYEVVFRYKNKDHVPHYWSNYNDAYNWLLSILNCLYYKYTRKHKQSKINYKVWYNKKGD